MRVYGVNALRREDRHSCLSQLTPSHLGKKENFPFLIFHFSFVIVGMTHGLESGVVRLVSRGTSALSKPGTLDYLWPDDK
jgi:hypothetical protein